MKNYFRHKFSIITVLLFMVSMNSCDTLELDLVDDPSSLNPENADLVFLFNQVQLSYNGVFNSLQYSGAQVTRIELMRTSGYLANFDPSTFNGAWNVAYRGVLINNKLFLSKVAEAEAGGADFSRYKAISKIIEANTWVMLADYFNDIPFSEALQGSSNFNPKRDNARDIYEAAYQMLNDATNLIDNLSPNAVPVSSDLYFGSDMIKWKRAANSLKLQMIINSRLQSSVAQTRFNQLITDNFFINNNADDLQFNYGTTQVNPDSRHPFFVNQYQAQSSIYLSRDFINMMLGDPREHYYFYRQRQTNFTVGSEAGDALARTHGSTLPNIGTDFDRMTVHGVFPYGGNANSPSIPSSYQSTTPTMGLQGAGINILASNYATQFLIAEGQLTMNSNVTAARSALSNAITAHMNKVRLFGTGIVTENPITAGGITTYVNNVLTEYDSASDKLEIIMREFHKASWGNGIQAYNNFRRTGKPSNLAALPFTPADGFVYRMPYPSVYISNNLNPDNVALPISQRIWWADNSINLNY